MTEAEAMSACKTFMDESPSFKMCKDIPNVNPDIAMNTCVLDILVIFIKVVYLLKKDPCNYKFTNINVFKIMGFYFYLRIID